MRLTPLQLLYVLGKGLSIYFTELVTNAVGQIRGQPFKWYNEIDHNNNCQFPPIINDTLMVIIVDWYVNMTNYQNEHLQS